MYLSYWCRWYAKTHQFWEYIYSRDYVCTFCTLTSNWQAEWNSIILTTTVTVILIMARTEKLNFDTQKCWGEVLICFQQISSTTLLSIFYKKIAMSWIVCTWRSRGDKGSSNYGICRMHCVSTYSINMYSSRVVSGW